MRLCTAEKGGHMVQADSTYRVIRTLPRKGETYTVTDRRTGVTTIRTANKAFKRDKRNVFVPVDAPAA